MRITRGVMSALSIQFWILTVFPLLLLAGGCITQVEKKIPFVSDAKEDLGDSVSDVAQDVAGDQLDDSADAEDLFADTDAQGDTADTQSDVLVPVDTATVGPAGGRWLFSGGVVMDVPEGALTSDVEVEILKFPVEPPEGAVLVTDVWAVMPSGTHFDKPITLTLPRNPHFVTVDDWYDLKGFISSTEAFDEATELLPAFGSFGGKSVQILTSHFSIVAAGIKADQQGGNCLDHELCNGLDDNCDGSTDEEPVAPTQAECSQVGVCATALEAECVEGAWQCSYNSNFYEADDEVSCDLKDNDCDGSTDEGIFGDAGDFPDASCLLSGVCATNEPFVLCAMGQWFCDYSDVMGYEGASESSCDGFDNDCDGSVDEGTCRLMESCTNDSEVCESGNCAEAYGDGNGSYCVSAASSCVLKDGDNVKEVVDGGSLCLDASEIILCEGGTWSAPTTCTEVVGGWAECNLELDVCESGCDVDEDCEDNGNLCDGVPMCDDGECVTNPASVVTCTNDDCNIFQCVPGTGVCEPIPANNGGNCSDGDLCHLTGTCQSGTCISPGPVVCDDDNDCTEDSCSASTGDCVFNPLPLIGNGCDDSNPCTLNDLCITGGICQGDAKDCSDTSECTQDSCDETDGTCIHDGAPFEGGQCDDGSPCVLGETCQSGECLGVPTDCNDDNDCTEDLCLESDGSCEHNPTNQDGSCQYPDAQDGNLDPCTPVGVCDDQGVCQPGTDLCDCREDADCVSFDNGDLCDGVYRCNVDTAPYQCVYDPESMVSCGTTLDTDCRKNQCDPGTGICGLTDQSDALPCSDGDACSLGDECLGGDCVSTEALDCTDGNACTDDDCDPVSGCLNTPFDSGTLCSDLEPCTIGDSCDGAGTCVPGAPRDPSCDDQNVCTADTCSEDGLDCINDPIPNCCADDTECNQAGGELCYLNDCCLPICNDPQIGNYQCGDDGCGATCGDCVEGEVCFESLCCLPNCDLKSCGDDGCGGSCGDCPVDDICTDGFQCCTPQCQGRECGSDQCGGTCGACDPGYLCSILVGVCEVCAPACTGKDCGDDGCGGSCGDCVGDEVCAPGGLCCLPDCTGRVCGDDGCGGSCGGCESWQVCNDGQCDCDICCTLDGDCSYHELCSGQTDVGGTFVDTCEAKTSVYSRTFEGEATGTIPAHYDYSWASFQNPLKVNFSEDGSLANRGNYSLYYTKIGSDSGSWWFDLPLPDQTTPSTSVLSFFFKCTYGAAVSFTIDVLADGQTVDQVTNAECDSTWHRHAIDLSAVASQKVRMEFRVNKIDFNLVRFYLDDFYVLADGCRDFLTCVSFSQSSNECILTNTFGGSCYIDYLCYEADAVSPDIECAVCNPGSNNDTWTPSNDLCDDGNPDTTDVCDFNSGGCVHN